MPRRKHKQHKRSDVSNDVAVASPSPAGKSRAAMLWHDVKKSVVLSATIVVAMILFEHTPVGEHVERLGYDVLQSRLRSADIPVTVVDISELASKSWNATPRETIKRAIAAIAERNPRAIGVDIDFSPDDFGYLRKEDPAFFDSCLDIRKQKGIPVLLGIARTALKPPAQWLGSEKYQSLAANIYIPLDSRLMLHSLDVGGRISVRSLSALLANAYAAAQDVKPKSLPAMKYLERVGFVENISTIVLAKGLTVREFWIDYSPIDEIRNQRLQSVNPAFLNDAGNRRWIEDHVVILGDVVNAGAADRFSARGEEYPGVLLHACAANTLITGPLYVVTALGRLTIDIICIVLVLACVTLIRWMYERGGSKRVAVSRLEFVLMCILLLAPLALGVAFVRSTRILWNDFLLGASALLLHPSFEHRLEELWDRSRSFARRIFSRVAFEQPEGHQ